MYSMEINKQLLEVLFVEAKESPRLRQNFDLRTLLPGTVVPIHQHENTTETVICLCGKLDEVIYEEVILYENGVEELTQGMDAQDVARKVEYREVQRIHLNPTETKYGCQVPKGVWHTVEVIEPSVIFEAKDGAYVR